MNLPETHPAGMQQYLFRIWYFDFPKQYQPGYGICLLFTEMLILTTHPIFPIICRFLLDEMMNRYSDMDASFDANEDEDSHGGNIKLRQKSFQGATKQSSKCSC